MNNCKNMKIKIYKTNTLWGKKWEEIPPDLQEIVKIKPTPLIEKYLMWI